SSMPRPHAGAGTALAATDTASQSMKRKGADAVRGVSTPEAVRNLGGNWEQICLFPCGYRVLRPHPPAGTLAAHGRRNWEREIHLGDRRPVRAAVPTLAGVSSPAPPDWQTHQGRDSTSSDLF